MSAGAFLVLKMVVDNLLLRLPIIWVNGADNLDMCKVEFKDINYSNSNKSIKEAKEIRFVEAFRISLIRFLMEYFPRLLFYFSILLLLFVFYKNLGV